MINGNKTRKFDVVTVLDNCVDLILSGGDVVPAFGQTEKLVGSYLLEMGGSTAIFACQAAKLGLRTAGIGCVGEDPFGRLVLDRLAEAGVYLEAVTTELALKTGLGLALCVPGDRAILTYSGTIDVPGMETRLASLLPRSRHLHIGSYYLMNHLRPELPALVRRAKAHGVTVSLDTNWDPSGFWDDGLRDLLPMVDLFLPNAAEAMAVAGTDRLEDALRWLLERVPTIGLKRGKDGATLLTRQGRWDAPSVDVPVVDAIGAGDSFDAGVVAGMLRGLLWEDSLRLGCLCGSMSTRKAGGFAGQVGFEAREGGSVRGLPVTSLHGEAFKA